MGVASLSMTCPDQETLDRWWHALTDGGQPAAAEPDDAQVGAQIAREFRQAGPVAHGRVGRGAGGDEGRGLLGLPLDAVVSIGVSRETSSTNSPTYLLPVFQV